MAVKSNKRSFRYVLLLGLGLGVVAFGAGAQGEPPPRPFPPPPPQEALTACGGLAEGESCGFVTPRGHELNGSCRLVRDDAMACVPAGHGKGHRPMRPQPEEQS